MLVTEIYVDLAEKQPGRRGKKIVRKYLYDRATSMFIVANLGQCFIPT